MANKPKRKKPPVPQTPRESLIEGNRRVKGPNGRTTWEKKAPVTGQVPA